MNDPKECSHPFTSWITAGMTFDDVGAGSVHVERRKNVRTFIWCAECGAIGVQKEGAPGVEWRLPKERS